MKEAVLAIGSLFISISAPIGGHSMRPILQFLLMVFGTKCIYCQMARDKFTTKQHLSNVTILWHMHENNAELREKYDPMRGK